MSKRVLACLLALCLLVSLAGCGSGSKTGQLLTSGWLVRFDGQGVGENEGWMNGFKEEVSEAADTVWYCNQFSAGLNGGGRVILSLVDLGETAKVWLNGKEVADLADGLGLIDLDVTSAVKRSGSNMLAIKATGGMQASVEKTGLSVRPDVLVQDIRAKADPVSGEISAIVSVDNGTDKPQKVTLELELTAMETGKVMARLQQEAEVGSGVTAHEFTLEVEDYIFWSTSNPFLYDLKAQVTNGKDIDSASFTVGFAEMGCDESGYLLLNGEPVLLSTVTIPQDVMYNEARMRKFVDYARTVEFNAIRPEGGRASQMLLTYCDQTGMIVENVLTPENVGAAARDAVNHVSALLADVPDADVLAELRKSNTRMLVFKDGAQSNAASALLAARPSENAFSELMGAGKAAYVSVCEGLYYPANPNQDDLLNWYAAGGLDKVFGTAQDALTGAAHAYVNQAADVIRALRDENLVGGILYNGSLEGYPSEMLETMNDGINDLRFNIEAPDVVRGGESFRLKISLSNFNILWNQKFSVYVKISGNAGDTGLFFEKTVEFTPEQMANGAYQQNIPIMDESVSINAPAGTYYIAAEFSNYAYGTCGERVIYVAGSNSASGSVYASGLSSAASAALKSAGIGVNSLNEGNIPSGSVVLVNGELSDAVVNAAKNGAKVILLNAGAVDSLPVNGAFSESIDGFVLPAQVSPVFGRQAVYNGYNDLSVPFFFRSDEECDCLVSGYSFAREGIAEKCFDAPVQAISYGSVIGTYPCGSGSLTVCTANLSAAAGNPVADAMLVAAVASVQ